jgi:hypothetical protein
MHSALRLRGIIMERQSIRISAWLVSGLLILGIYACSARAQASMKVIDAPQGGKIDYGIVDGASTLADALEAKLRTVRESYGEKPRIGRVYKVRGTDSMAVFFTVADHNHDNKQVTGLLIGATTGSKQVEAAIVSDAAERLSQTENSMLLELCSAWHPEGLASSYSLLTRKFAAWESCLTTGARWAPPAKLHKVVTQDKSTSASIPDGWKLDPNSGNEAMLVTGPNGELAALGFLRLAVDPASLKQGTREKDAAKIENSDKIVYPANANLAKAFPDLLQQWRKLNGMGPAELDVDHAEPVAADHGVRCVHVTGQVNPDGRGMQQMNTLLCFSPLRQGNYTVQLFHTLLPNAVADRERTTMGAILASYRLEGFIEVNPKDYVTPGIAVIEQIGRKASALDCVPQPDYDAHPIWWNAARIQDEFSDDGWVAKCYRSYFNESVAQTLASDQKDPDWFSAANAVVKGDPDRFESLPPLKSTDGSNY